MLGYNQLQGRVSAAWFVEAAFNLHRKFVGAYTGITGVPLFSFDSYYSSDVQVEGATWRSSFPNFANPLRITARTG